MEPKKNFYAAFVWTVGITVACLVSTSSIPNVSVPGNDKMVHAFFYFVFTVLWFQFFKKRFVNWRFGFKATLVLFFTLFYGTLIEVLQEFFTATRKADFFDVLANVTGSAIGVLILWLVKQFTQNSKSVQ